MANDRLRRMTVFRIFITDNYIMARLLLFKVDLQFTSVSDRIIYSNHIHKWKLEHYDTVMSYNDQLWLHEISAIPFLFNFIFVTKYGFFSALSEFDNRRRTRSKVNFTCYAKDI